MRAYSLGVRVASTDHCSVSWFWMCLTRASRLSAGASSSAARRERTGNNDPAEILSTLIGASAFAAGTEEGERLSELS